MSEFVFTKGTTKKKLVIPNIIMEQSGFEKGEMVEIHALMDAVVVLKKEMTAMELVHAIAHIQQLSINLSIYLAQVCGYMAGMLNSYLVNRSWTFKTSSRFFSFQMVKFVISNLLTLAVSIGMLKLLIDFMGFGTIFAKLPTVCVTILLNFILSRFWVFK